MNLRLILIISLFLSISCKKEKVRVVLDDAMGIIPEIKSIEGVSSPNEILQTADFTYIQSEYTRKLQVLDTAFNLVHSNTLNGYYQLLGNRTMTQTPDGSLYHFYVLDNTSLYLDQIDEDGDLLSTRLITDTLDAPNMLDCWAEADDRIICTFFTNVFPGQLCSIWAINPLNGDIEKIYGIPFYIRVISFEGNNKDGYWLTFGNAGRVGAASKYIMYFDKDWKYQLTHNYFDANGTSDPYYPGGVTIVNPDGADIFIKVLFSKYPENGYTGLAHLQTSNSGIILNSDIYPVLEDHEIKSIHWNGKEIEVLSQESQSVYSGSTRSLVYTRLSKEGALLSSKILRNTTGQWNYGTILQDGDMRRVLAFEGNQQMLKSIRF